MFGCIFQVLIITRCPQLVKIPVVVEQVPDRLRLSSPAGSDQNKLCFELPVQAQTSRARGGGGVEVGFRVSGCVVAVVDRVSAAAGWGWLIGAVKNGKM